MIPASLIPAIGYILATILAGLALYYWRRSTSLYTLLVDGANRYEELRQRNGQLEQLTLQGDEKLKVQREQAQRLEKGLDDARQKTADLIRRLEAKEHEVKFVSEKLELQKGHLEKQLAKAEERLRNAEEQQADLTSKLQRIGREGEQRLQVAQQEAALREGDLKARVRELDSRLQAIQKERDDLSQRLKSADPVEMRKIKRKLAQYARLYAGMKGQREMVEERNRNWEVALRRLSAWILRETSGPLADIPEGIGPLVGQALTVVGSQLVHDSESWSPAGHRAAATPADSMDDPGLLPDDADLDSDAAQEAALHPERALTKEKA